LTIVVLTIVVLNRRGRHCGWLEPAACGQDAHGSSQMGFYFSLTYIIFLLCGGMQALWGPLLAALLLTAAPEVLRFTA